MKLLKNSTYQDLINELEYKTERLELVEKKLLNKHSQLKIFKKKYGLGGAKSRILVGGKGSGKTHFIKNTIIPNLKGDYTIIDIFDEYSDFEQSKIFNYHKIKDNKSKKGISAVCKHIEKQNRSTTIIIDGLEYITILPYGQSSLNRLSKLLIGRRYIVTYHGYRHTLEFIRSVGGTVDFIFEFPLISDKERCFKEVSKLNHKTINILPSHLEGRITYRGNKRLNQVKIKST